MGLRVEKGALWFVSVSKMVIYAKQIFGSLWLRAVKRNLDAIRLDSEKAYIVIVFYVDDK